jgi:hypothetical protein
MKLKRVCFVLLARTADRHRRRLPEEPQEKSRLSKLLFGARNIHPDPAGEPFSLGASPPAHFTSSVTGTPSASASFRSVLTRATAVMVHFPFGPRGSTVSVRDRYRQVRRGRDFGRGSWPITAKSSCNSAVALELAFFRLLGRRNESPSRWGSGSALIVT